MNPQPKQRAQIHHERRQVLLFRAALVGVVAGFAAVLFQYAVRKAEDTAQQVGSLVGPAAWIIIPLLSAGLAGLAAWGTKKFAPEAAGSGIPHVKAALMNLRQIRPIPLITTKIGGGLLALAAGMSLGREGPTVQIGAAFGHLLGKTMKASRRSFAPLVASGSGAGLAAAFNAPLAGFLFVMEEMKREMTPLTYGTALVSSVTAVAVKRIFFGQLPEFKLSVSQFVPISALPAVVVLGALAGIVAVSFNKGIMRALDLRDKLNWPRWLWGGLIGLAAGLTIVALPMATGGGHHAAELLLQGKFQSENLLAILALLLVVKFFLTIFSFSSGAPGGIFAPMLVMGAILGYAFGLVTNIVFPAYEVVPAFFATIGMAAFLAASVRAPLTGVVLIFEMTAEYRLLYALLLGAFVAYAVAEAFRDKPIYEALLDRDLHKGSKELATEDQPRVVDLLIEPDSEFDGKAIKDLPLPPGCLIVQILRHDHHVVPNGKTVIEEGDLVTLLSDNTSTGEWVKLYDGARAP